MPTVQEVLDYLGYDYADDVIKRNIKRIIPVADFYLRGSIGRNYPAEDPRIKELALIVVADLYENQELIEKVSGNVRRLVNDLELQLRLDMRRENTDV